MTTHPHCCQLMSDFIDDPRLPIAYYAPMREYRITQLRSDRLVFPINYCPWCDTKLPLSLREAYYAILEKDYGIAAKDVPDATLPDQFTTDAWWRQRRL